MGAIRDAFARDTAVDPAAWSEERPSTGHCAVVALLVQELLGGMIWRVEIDGGSHYYTTLTDGSTIDLTRDQFEMYEPELAVQRSPASLLANPDTRARYHTFRKRCFAPSDHHL